MAEILGAVASAMTLASLFGLCVEAFSLIRQGRRQGADLKKLILKLDIEKWRLYIWGDAMGLITAAVEGQQSPIESSPLQGVVRDTLHTILQLLTDTQDIKKRYGCQEDPSARNQPALLPEADTENAVDNLAASFSHFQIFSEARDTLKKFSLIGRWLIDDRKKFGLLITEAKELIDGLQDITKSLSTVARQEGMARSHIQQISNVETLTLVAEVCEVDYPDISDAASVKVDVLSIDTTQRRDIENWAAQIDSPADMAEADLESLTVTELKHRIRELSERTTVSKMSERDLDMVVQKYLRNKEYKHAWADDTDSYRASLAASFFQQFILQTGTALHETDNTFKFIVARWSKSYRPDLIAIKMSNTGTASTEVHILSGANNYQSFMLQTGTALQETSKTEYDFAMADWNGDGMLDLFVIKKSNSDTESTKIHVLSGASKFQTFILHTGTPLYDNGDNFAFAFGDWTGDGKPDLLAIKKSNTGTATTEVHILSGASNFQQFMLQTGTALTETDNTFDFVLADWNGYRKPDLVAIKKSNTETDSTEVHVLSGALDFQEFILQTGTVLHETGEDFAFAMADWNLSGRPDLIAIKNRNTGSNSTEMHVIAG